LLRAKLGSRWFSASVDKKFSGSVNRLMMSDISRLSSKPSLPQHLYDAEDAPFSLWGGLPAIIGASEDFEQTRQSDAAVNALLLKLSRMDDAEPTYESVIDTMVQCAFTIEEVNKLNSPLLDGLWTAITGSPPTEHSPFLLNPPGSLHGMVMRAIEPKPYAATVEYLLAHGARVNDEDGEALCVAAGKGFLDVVQVLLARRADVNVRRGAPVRLAAQGAFPEILAALLARDPIVDFFPLLRTAAKAGREEVLHMLLEHGADLHAHEEHLLITAIQNNHLGVVDMLLRAGANPDAPVVLAIAASSPGHSQHVRLFLEHGANIKPYGHTTLSMAMRCGDADMVDVLLEAGVDVERNNQDIRDAIIEQKTQVLQPFLVRRPLAFVKHFPEYLSFASENRKTEVVTLFIHDAERLRSS